MVIVIHQPHFLPWLGYFNKLVNANCLVFQDNVQFRRRYFQNRTLIRSNQNETMWLTIPIHAHRNTTINNVITVDEFWKEEILTKIYFSYNKSPFFYLYWSDIQEAINQSENLLVDINYKTLSAILKILNINIKILFASSYKVTGSPTEQLVSICEIIGATDYIFGEGGGIYYHGTSMFKKHGIKVHYQNFFSNFKPIAEQYYTQCLNLSVIDYLFNIGAEETSKIINDCWKLNKRNIYVKKFKI